MPRYMLDTDTCSSIMKRSYTGGSDGFVTSAAAPIATEWNEPVLGRDFHPQRTSAFHGAQHSNIRVDSVRPCSSWIQPDSTDEAALAASFIFVVCDLANGTVLFRGAGISRSCKAPGA
jgi:hypothetical protein